MSSGTLRVAAHGLCIQHERVLLTLPGESVPEAGAWGLPGGGIEWLEAPADALRRELREETGLDAVVGEVIGVYSAAVAVRGSTVHFLSVVYRLRDAVGTLTDEVAGSTDRAAWVALDEVGSLPLSPLASFGLGLLDIPTR